jgi:two-component system sensor histidine kinase BarA
MAYADIIFAAPEFLDAFHATVAGAPDQWVPARICVSELGDAAPDRLLVAGVAEDLLIKPLSRHDVMDQIRRILEGKLRGVEAVRETAAVANDLPSFAGARVLAADDSAVNREVVREALLRLQIESVVVEDGRAALAAALEGGFDLILMDCSMPNMDGYEATRAIRVFEAENKRRATPVIALTAHVQGEVDRWRAAGMNEYVTKPFTIATLANAIASFIPEKKKAAPKGPRPAPAAPEAVKILPPRDVAFEAAPRMIRAEGSTYEPNPEPAPASSATTAPAPFEAAPEAPATSSVSPAFDEVTLKALAEMGSSSSDIVARALKLFAEHSKPAAIRVAKAVRAGEVKEIKSAAHALKSMSINVGAKTLGAAAGAIEALALDERQERDFAPLMTTLRDAFAAAHAELPALLERFSRKAA